MDMTANSGNAYAMTIIEFGPADIFTRTPIEPVQSGPGETLVKTIATGANPPDYKMYDGSSGLCAKFTLPAVSRREATGEVVTVDEGMDSFAPGDRVSGMRGFDDLRGTYATHNVSSVDGTVRALDSFDGVTAAGPVLVRITATVAANQLAEVKSSGTILIHGVGGGVGQLMTQLAATHGATVLVSASPCHHKKLVGFSVQHINYITRDVFGVVRQQLPEDVGVVLDGVCLNTFFPSLDVLVPDGRIVALPSLVDLAPVREHGIGTHIPATSNDMTIYVDLADRAIVNEISFLIGLTKNLIEVAKIHRILKDGHTDGEIAMTVEQLKCVTTARDERSDTFSSASIIAHRYQR